TYDVEADLVCPEVLFIPTMVRHSSRTAPLFAQAVSLVRSLIWQRNNMPPLQPRRRMYVSRSRVEEDKSAPLNRRTLLNRDRIETLARQAGFEIVHPEQHPLIEQFAMFRDAEAIIGEYGSALHTCIFSEQAPIICALQGAGPTSTFLQSGICHALDQPLGYVFGPATEDGSAFTIAEDAFTTCLDLIFSGAPLA
ncbi:MAG TPA: glycosyltransferase family 61 protein, partial [Rhodopila sp.]|nr:glycosyltransferase family 61 protein [Rhodopila sp.]